MNISNTCYRIKQSLFDCKQSSKPFNMFNTIIYRAPQVKCLSQQEYGNGSKTFKITSMVKTFAKGNVCLYVTFDY